MPVLTEKFNGHSGKYYRIFDDNIDFRRLSDLSRKIKSKYPHVNQFLTVHK